MNYLQKKQLYTKTDYVHHHLATVQNEQKF